MPDDIALLTQVPLFRGLPREELVRLAATLRRLAFEPGAALFFEGDPGNHFYVIRSGHIEVVRGVGTPDESVVDARGPGEFIGETSLVSPERVRTATVRARGPVEAWELSRADFDALLARQPLLAYDMLRLLSQRMSALHYGAMRTLLEKNRELTQAYEELEALQAQRIEAERLERELEVAHSIQMSLLPQHPPRLAGFNFGARMLAARAVGGDFFDFIELDGGRLGLVIGDATGKGVPAALFVAQARALLRAESCRGATPAEVLLQVNRLLLEINATGLFVTILYGVLDPATHEFSFARAGHEPPYLCAPGFGPAPLPLGRGQPLGMLAAPHLDVQSVQLKPHSRLLLYTDGIADMRNENDEPFGEERLRQAFETFHDDDAQRLCDGILGQVTAYRGAAAQYDDVTLVAVECVA